MTTRDSGTRNTAALLISILAALGTIISTFTQLGVAGSCILASGYFTVIALLLTEEYWRRLLPRWLRIYYGKVKSSTPATWCYFIALGLLLLGAVLWWTGISEGRLLRARLADHKIFLRVDLADYASETFREPTSVQLGNQQSRERARNLPWLQWMDRGATQSRRVEPSPGSTHESPAREKELVLLYVESEPFGRKFTNSQLSVSVSDSIRIVDSATFLVSGTDDPPWWNPMLRQMRSTVNESGKSIDVYCTDPNPGERIWAFLRVELEASHKPNADHILPTRTFEVHR